VVLYAREDAAKLLASDHGLSVSNPWCVHCGGFKGHAPGLPTAESPLKILLEVNS
jgi:hypothetical protein